MGSSKCTRRRSIGWSSCLPTSSATSWAVMLPNSRPSSPAWAAILTGALASREATASASGQAPGDEVVPSVPVGDLDDVPGRPQLVDLLLEDDPHREAAYGRSAISLAFFTA